MDIVFSNLNVSVNQKQYLHCVSGSVNRGQILSIMGPSGASKTTLLNILAGRYKHYKGTVEFDGIPFKRNLRWKMGYITQKEVFFPNLTLKQTLMYHALLVLPQGISYEAKEARVNDAITLLQLNHCVDTVMGDEITSGYGLSGGERKRASIACKLLSNPQVLFLDEPTSGLDANTAYYLVKILKTMVIVKKVSVILTIHQPASRIFYEFDKLLLLVKGRSCYYGDAASLMEFLAPLGIICPDNTNPADFVIDSLHENSSAEKIADIYRRVDVCSVQKHASSKVAEDELSVKQSRKISVFYDSEGQTLEMRTRKWQCSVFYQIRILMHRRFHQSKYKLCQKPFIIIHILHAVLLSLLWFQQDISEQNLYNIYGFFFFVVADSVHFVKFLGFNSILRYHQVILNEKQESLCQPSAYFFSTVIVENVVDNIYRFLMYFIAYCMVGLGSSEAVWLYFASAGVFLLALVLFHNLAMIAAVIFKNFEVANTFMLLIIHTNVVIGGLLVGELPSWIKWLRNLTFLKYIFGALLSLEFHYGKPIKCDSANRTALAGCRIGNTSYVSPEEALKSLDYTLPLWINMVVLVGLVVCSWCVLYLVMKYLDKPKKIGSDSRYR